MVRILVSGDIHMGRQSTHLPEGVDGRRLSASAGWLRLVEAAISEQVHAVVLSGDLIDRENRYFEAFGPLKTGLDRLAEADIVTLAVAGNHDFDTLPRFSQNYPQERFHLLGLGGNWESFILSQNGRPQVEFLGWSFPRQHYYENPLDSGPGRSSREIPRIGILHGDLDQSHSSYAPLSSGDLLNLDVSLWLLGHIHNPTTKLAGADPSPRILYPGTPQALDPSESGIHGALIVTMDNANRFDARAIPLSAVHYSDTSIDLSGRNSPGACETEIIARLREQATIAAKENTHLEHLVVRPTLTGITSVGHELSRYAENLADELHLTEMGVEIHVDRIINQTRGGVDLQALAQQDDMVGWLSRTLSQLECTSSESETSALGGRARERLARILESNAYMQLRRAGEAPPTPERVRRILARQAERLLDVLLAQKS